MMGEFATYSPSSAMVGAVSGCDTRRGRLNKVTYG